MKYLIAIFILISAVACSTVQVSYPVGTTDATIKIDANAKTITTANRIRLSYTATDRIGYSRTNNASALNGAINTLRSELRNRRYFKQVAQVNEFQTNAGSDMANILTVDQQQSVARGADLIASLELFNQNFKDEYKVEIRREPIGDKVYKEVDYFVGVRTINLEIGYRLYDVKAGKVIDEQTYEEQVTYEAESLQRIRATQLLDANFNRELSALGNKYGRVYAARISPINHFKYREIYASGNDYLEKGAVEVRAEQWADAEKFWQRGIKRESNRKKLAKLYHNLAITAEKNGDITQAKEYAKLAANQHPIGAKTQSIIGY